MYSEYTTHFTHNIQFVYPVYNLYCIVHTDYTDSQLYFDYILHYIYRMCVKVNMLYVQCTVYTLHIYAHSAIRLLFTLKLCIYPSQDQRILRALVK